jgi:hypothetical protein
MLSEIGNIFSGDNAKFKTSYKEKDVWSAK